VILPLIVSQTFFIGIIVPGIAGTFTRHTNGSPGSITEDAKQRDVVGVA